MPLYEALSRLPRVATPLSGGSFDQDDDAYAQTVREAIGTGASANFVIRRSFVADITGYGPHSALAVFRRMLESESGAYWTFVIHTGERTFVLARHRARRRPRRRPGPGPRGGRRAPAPEPQRAQALLRLPDELKYELVATLLGQSVQLAGRGRRGQTHVELHFIDGAFHDPTWGSDLPTLIRGLLEQSPQDDLAQLGASYTAPPHPDRRSSQCSPHGYSPLPHWLW
ncbi:hypothetical protein [Streptomyces sp. NPDC058295]|uniref:hypothetical protein n=1 Tax=Streptomyces sp. NPDC058295 TaxID=3346431 RepID=UPI0036F14C29